MSDNAQYTASDDAHTGPIKNPKQLLATVFFAFIAPILIIVALVMYVVSGVMPSGEAKGDDMSLYGVTADSRARDIQSRLAKIGSVEIRDANRELALGEVVFKTQCVACHGAPGIPGAPHLGDKAAWAPRIGEGYATLLQHALQGKGAMPPQGGGDYEDVEIGRAVVYMANAGGASFPVPDRPAADAASADGTAPVQAMAATMTTPTATVSGAPTPVGGVSAASGGPPASPVTGAPLANESAPAPTMLQKDSAEPSTGK